MDTIDPGSPHSRAHSQVPPPVAIVVVKETWLTRRPRSSSALVASFSTFLLTAGSALYWAGPVSWQEQMPASGRHVLAEGEIWRLWTALFAHADAGHLLANSFLFFILGFLLYGYFGFRVFPLAALIGGGLTNLVVLFFYQPAIRVIGASGGVYWMGGAWLTLYFLLSRQKSMTQRILRSLGVGLVLFMPAEAFEPRTSYLAHFVGFVLGVLFALPYYLWNRSMFRSAEIRELVHPEPELEPESDSESEPDTSLDP